MRTVGLLVSPSMRKLHKKFALSLHLKLRAVKKSASRRN